VALMLQLPVKGVGGKVLWGAYGFGPAEWGWRPKEWVGFLGRGSDPFPHKLSMRLPAF